MYLVVRYTGNSTYVALCPMANENVDLCDKVSGQKRGGAGSPFGRPEIVPGNFR